MGTETKQAADILADLMSKLSGNARLNVTLLRYQAIGYVWGVQDGSGVEKDSNAAWTFGTAYAVHAAEYESQAIVCRHNIPDAYKRWAEGKPIREASEEC